MNPSHDRYGPRDSTPLIEVDSAFVGLNMAAEPDTLAPGEYSFARNVRVRRKKIYPRRGAQRMAWAASANGTAVYGSCAFRSPTGVSYILKARANHCEAVDPVGGVQQIAYPGGVTLSSEVELVQAFDRVLMFRGASGTLEWKPPSSWINPFGSAFAAISVEGTGGTQPMPAAPWGYLFKNRMLVPVGRDSIAASDVLNYTRFDPISQQFRINAGDEQSVKGVIKGGRNSLVIGRDSSFFILENFVADLSLVSQDALPIDVGLGPRRTLVSYGTEIFWMGGDFSIYSMSQALDNRLQGEERAFSDPIEPLIASIKPVLANQCVAKIWNKMLWVAVPLGGDATALNAFLVYDFTVGAWVGVDTSALYEIQNLMIFPYQGRQRLFFVHTSGDVYLLEEGDSDVGPAGSLEIPTEFISRGYKCGSEGSKRFVAGEVVLAASGASYVIESGVNGGNM